jgi:hypothetical protein
MKTVKPESKRPAFQGDVAFLRVAKMPAKVEEVKREKGALIVTHSETGHHHSILDDGPQLFAVPGDAMVSYLRIPASAKHADVVHQRPWDTHETLRLLADDSVGETIYEIRRQREHTPEGWRRVED